MGARDMGTICIDCGAHTEMPVAGENVKCDNCIFDENIFSHVDQMERTENQEIIDPTIVHRSEVQKMENPQDSLLEKIESLKLKESLSLDLPGEMKMANSLSMPVAKNSAQLIEAADRFLPKDEIKNKCEVETFKLCKMYGKADISSEYESGSNVSSDSIASGYVSSISPTSHYTRMGN